MKGLTLIELMLVVAIMAILLSVGVPSFYQLIAQEKLTKQSNELVAQLSLMRSEAIQRQSVVFLCPLYAGQCDADISSGIAGRRLYVWGSGFVSAARGQGASAIEHNQSGDQVVQFVDLPPSVLIVSNRKKFSFDPRGHAVSGSIFLCAEGQPGRRIVISALGRVRVERQAQDTCELFNL
ncbi:GspH/FimT family pseudopilin [Salinibius halmophilus]|uniref:GspH/FimT family pseudopilin n=1 Tax=Salinibius halmophilus TaxID=1853216 RepID=UPI000E674DF1|nr:GspH/FimT family pseudopilin [Salinibius halmophilus]